MKLTDIMIDSLESKEHIFSDRPSFIEPDKSFITSLTLIKDCVKTSYYLLPRMGGGEGEEFSLSFLREWVGSQRFRWERKRDQSGPTEFKGGTIRN